MTHKTEQEDFWQGEFGNHYVMRNDDASFLRSNKALFNKILQATSSVSSVLELGANVGLNLKAIKELAPHVSVSAVEINEEACRQLMTIEGIRYFHQSILEFDPQGQQWDFVFTKGVLIHIHPDELPHVYRLMYEASCRYIMVCEYYNPTPQMVPYRGHHNRLFKRDFAGDLLERYQNLSLVDYGFVYRRDPVHPQDDMTWFLLEKQ